MNRLAIQIAFALLLLVALAHRTSAQVSGGQNTSGAAPAATGLDTTTQMTENPPLSGLDEPTFEPGYGARSYLAPKAEVSESVNSNATNEFSNTNITTTSRALGSVELQKLWKMHPLAVDYVGGVDWYNGPRSHVYQVHSLAATQRFLWRTGQFALRDSFSYLPEGAFGFGSFGGAGGASGGGGFGGGGLGGGGVTGGTGGIFTNGQFGSVGTQPRITNMAIADVSQYLSPRSSMVLSAGYGLTHFLNNPQTSSCASTAGCYFNSQETILQAGYNRQISRQNQVSVVYAFEELHFPTSSAGTLNVNMLQLLFGHRISGKLDFLIGGGPEWVHRSQSEEELVTPIGTFPLGLPCLHPTVLTPCVVVKSSFLTGSARASLRYHWSARTELLLTYLRYISPGSGFFGGANTDVVRFAATHSLARRWNVTADTGYSRSSRLLTATASIAAGSANYHYWYVGGGVHRQLGRYFGAFASYQYNAFGFGSNGCTGTSSVCGRSYGRNVGLIGLHWTPHPIRLD
jgi:hypothetical protein